LDSVWHSNKKQGLKCEMPVFWLEFATLLTIKIREIKKIKVFKECSRRERFLYRFKETHLGKQVSYAALKN
jgi:hypothetical protein